MTDAEKQVLLALASRCETEEPSDELWHAIAFALGWRRDIDEDDHRIVYWTTPDGHIWNLPDWLRSLDAAVTLVPEGCGYTLRSHRAFMDSASVWRDLESNFNGSGRKPALALCAAALRARAA